MAVNQVIYNSVTLIDLTSDTITASDVKSGVTFHTKDGTSKSGTLSINHLYVSSSAPTSSDGEVGDYWIQAT